MRVAILGDTHVPSRASGLPEWVVEELRAADHVVHTGDFDSPAAYERVRDLSPDLTAVVGNMDPSNLGPPAVERVDLGGVRFVVTHGTGSPAGWQDRVAETVAEHAADGPTVGVAGHTHELVDERGRGYRLLNPGSATGARPARMASMLTAEVADGKLDVTVHER